MTPPSNQSEERENSSAETRAKKGEQPTPESSETTKPDTPSKRGGRVVDVTKQYLGSSFIFVGTPHKNF